MECLRGSAQRETLAEVDAADIDIVTQLVRGSGAEDAPLGDDVGAVGDAEGLADVVVGDQNADAAGLEVEDDLLQLEHGNGIDAAEGFVEEDKAGLDAKTAGNLDAAAFATGQRIAAGGADVAKVELVDKALGAGSAFAVAEGLGLKDGEDVFLDGELAEDGGLLRQVADAEVAGAQVHGNAGDIGVADHDATGLRLHEADNHVEAGGFAGAVGAEKTDHFAP